MSRRSGIGALSNNKQLNLNSSMEILKPLANDSSTMKIAGNTIMGSMTKQRMSAHTIDYNIMREDSQMSQTQKRNPYKNISITDMR